MELDSNYWSQRYQSNEIGWDAGTITPPLKEYIDQIKDKNISILIPGAGNAHEAEYLFKNGFKNVNVIDISKEPINNLTRRIPNFPQKNLIVSDFFELTGKFDLILEQTFFCAINPSLRTKYAEKMHELLNDNGKLVGVLFDNDKLSMEHPPFRGTKEEYLTYFNPFFNIKTYEKCYNSIKPRENSELFIILKKK